MAGLIGGITDAIGLTDYAGAESARNSANSALRAQSGMSKELLDWWRTNAAPYQLRLMERGNALYDEASLTDADYTRELGNVSSDVATAFGRSRDATARGLQRFGVRPDSGRFASIMTAVGNEQAGVEAAARNRARAVLRDTEFSRKAQALGLASGLNAPNYGLVGTGMGGLSSAAGQYASMASQADANNSAILGSIIGGAGYAFGKADGGEVKHRYADGKEVRAEKFMGEAERADMPMGGLRSRNQIRGEMRGPGTPISDSIPVQTEEGDEARLADGEVVMPTDTVAALGLELFRKDPERAAHMVGVKLLEEQIEETHEPAESQEENGLSVDPRGVDGMGSEGYACGGMVKHKKYADGGETSAWKTGLAMLGHGLANGLSRGQWLQGVQAGEAARENQMELERQAAERQRMEDERTRKQAFDTALSYGLEYAKANPTETTAEEQIGLATQAYDPEAYASGILAKENARRAREMALSDAKTKREQELADKEAERKYGLEKVRVEAGLKGRAQGARTRLYPIGQDEMGNKIYGRYDEETDQFMPVETPPAPMSQEEAMMQAESEASKKAGWFRSDETDFGPAGRDAWIQRRASEIMGASPKPEPMGATEKQAPPPAAGPASFDDALSALRKANPGVSEQDLRDYIGKTYPSLKPKQKVGSAPKKAIPAPEKKTNPMDELADIRRLSGAKKLGPATAKAQAERLKAIWNDLGPANAEKFALLDKLNRIAKGAA